MCVGYLSRLLTGSLVLCLLAQLPDSLVFGQEVLLLSHFLPIGPLVERLPARTGEGKGAGSRVNQESVVGRRQCLQITCARKVPSGRQTYPLSTRKESLHVLPFLFKWNLLKTEDKWINTHTHTHVHARTYKKNSDHLFTGLSASSSFRIDFPSISAGISTPAMSSRVGARSIFRTMWGLLRGEKRRSIGLIWVRRDLKHEVPLNQMDPLT